MSNPRELIAELREVISNPEQYAKVEHDLDRLADEIRMQEKDKYYREHPEEANNA